MWGLAALLLATAALPAAAIDGAPAEEPSAPVAPAAAAPRAPIRAQLEVRLNGARVGESLVLLDGDDAWMSVVDLEAYGLERLGGRRAEYAGRECVSLRSLAPGLAFALEERALTLALTAGPELLGRRRVDLGSRRPAGTIEGGEPSAFANYAVQGSAAGRVSGFGEAGVRRGAALAWSGFSVPYGGTFTRGLSSLALDAPERLQRLTAGDVAASMGGLGSAAVVGGLSLTREFGLDPYLVQAPRPATTAFAATPSTLEVYVNGALVRRQAVAPGTLDLTQIPVVAGTSAVQTIVRDAYGREQVYDLRATFSPGLLAPGLSDYGYHLGFTRDLAAGSLGYGRPVLLARHRIGTHEGLATLGGRAEASLDRLMVGPTLTLATVAGQLDLEFAGSVARGRTGTAGAVAWSWIERRRTVGLRLRGVSPQYATATLDLSTDRAVVELAGFVSVAAGRRLGLGLEPGFSRFRDAGNGASLTARADLSLGAGLSVLASVTGRSGGGAPGVSGLVMISWAAGARTTAHLSASGGDGGAAATAGAQRSLPVGPGYGYRVEATPAGPQQAGTALLQWQTQTGRYEAALQRTPAGDDGSLTAAGGVVLAGGRAFLTRPVQESFALLRVGVPGVRGYLENQEAGRTDGHGDLLLPALLPRYANRVSIQANDVPLDHEVGRVEQLVAPPHKGGVVARFGVVPIRAVSGRLVVDGDPGAEPPAYGEVIVEQRGELLRSPTTGDGRFFLERVRPGPLQGRAVWRGGACRFTIEVPEAAGHRDLGLVRCTRDAMLALETSPSP